MINMINAVVGILTLFITYYVAMAINRLKFNGARYQENIDKEKNSGNISLSNPTSNSILVYNAKICSRRFYHYFDQSNESMKKYDRYESFLIQDGKEKNFILPPNSINNFTIKNKNFHKENESSHCFYLKILYGDLRSCTIKIRNPASKSASEIEKIRNSLKYIVFAILDYIRRFMYKIFSTICHILYYIFIVKKIL